jgi:L-ascorbate metabolism protein UlaG (beta-lactamase superfamily)
MKNAGFQVEMIGHASLRVQAQGKTFLTDPWYVDPIGCNTVFHFPPLVHDVDALAAETDAIYISHIHPDHFDPHTLARFSKDIPIYIGRYRSKRYVDAVRSLGFSVCEVPFQTPTEVTGTPFEISILESDYDETDAFDSSIVIGAPGFTVFNNNDCYLDDAKYQWVADNYDIDYGFLGYSPASYYPLCFEFDEETKRRLLSAAAERKYGDFVAAAQRLQPGISVPFAMGLRFFHRSMLSLNIGFNSAPEAVRRVQALGLRGEVMGPGDRIMAGAVVERVSPLREQPEELQAIAALAEEKQDWAEMLWASEPGERPGLLESFRDCILGLWRHTRDHLPGIEQYVIAYRLVGQTTREFYFDFSRPESEVFSMGSPPRYDMRYTYPSGLLQQQMDGLIDWDDMHFSCRVSIDQRRYAKEFYAMLRSTLNEVPGTAVAESAAGA